MNIDTALFWVQEMLTTIVVLAAPVMVAAVSVGLGVAIFQAATSIQEMTLAYVPKMVAVVTVLFFLFGFMLQFAIDFTTRAFEFIPQLVN
jgi:flagellar biosynthetic protein FliQ